jgi:RNA polymerase sigma-70 factor (ECF subfamily)
MRLSYHTVIDHTRKRKINFSGIESAGQLEAEESPFADLVAQDRQRRIEEVFSRFEQLDRAILTLYYIEDKSIKQIAEVTGLANSNVKVRLYRARTRLKERFKDLKGYYG